MKKIILFSAVFFITSCVLVPVIDSFKKAGLTASDRKALLPQTLKKFHDAVQWGSYTEASIYVNPEKAPEVMAYVQSKIDNEKIVESKVKLIKFDDNAFTATVEINIRSYKVPVYIVNDKIEKQTWDFSLTDTWTLSEITEIKKK